MSQTQSSSETTDRERLAATTAKEPYEAPELIEHGQVQDLTQNGPIPTPPDAGLDQDTT